MKPDNLWQNTVKENTKYYFLYVIKRKKRLIRGKKLEDKSLSFIKPIKKLIDLNLIKKSLIIFTYVILGMKKMLIIFSN